MSLLAGLAGAAKAYDDIWERNMQKIREERIASIEDKKWRERYAIKKADKAADKAADREYLEEQAELKRTQDAEDLETKRTHGIEDYETKKKLDKKYALPKMSEQAKLQYEAITKEIVALSKDPMALDDAGRARLEMLKQKQQSFFSGGPSAGGPSGDDPLGLGILGAAPGSPSPSQQPGGATAPAEEEGILSSIGGFFGDLMSGDEEAATASAAPAATAPPTETAGIRPQGPVSTPATADVGGDMTPNVDGIYNKLMQELKTKGPVMLSSSPEAVHWATTLINRAKTPQDRGLLEQLVRFGESALKPPASIGEQGKNLLRGVTAAVK